MNETRKKRKKGIGCIKKFFLAILILLVAGVVSGLLFMSFHPVFGDTPGEEQQEAFEELENFRDGRFINEPDLEQGMDFGSLISLIREWTDGDRNRTPTEPLSVMEPNWEKIEGDEESLTWFGHSNFLLNLGGKRILIDPVFSDVVSPISFMGSRRFTKDIFPMIEALPPIDALFITHDHYDHLDYPSILALKEKTEHFFVPLGVEAHLMEWGIEEERITSMNWWEEVEWKGLQVAAVPARHYSNRTLFGAGRTLWSGWVIESEDTNLFISGDTSYGDHFKAIGEAFGPFDLTLMEGGQYDHRWADSHMFPEESLRAHQEVKGEVMMLMHWGAFSLAPHAWDDPIIRAVKGAEEKGISMIAPRIGETLSLEDLNQPINPWWEE